MNLSKHNTNATQKQLNNKQLEIWLHLEIFSKLLLGYNSSTYPQPSQTSKIKLFVKLFNGFQSLTIFAKSSTLDA